MHPVLITLAGYPVRSYAVLVGLAFLVALVVRRAETRRLGYAAEPGHRWVGVGALVGAAVGAKVGMILFTPWAGWVDVLARMTDLDFTGKTVVGGLIGGFIGVEIAKRRVGITHSTGDGWALSLPLAQAVGRLGCFLNGCCYGSQTDGPWGVALGGVSRHPVQLYEAALDLLLAGLLWRWRGAALPEGHLFRRYLVGYAVIRFITEAWRGDPSVRLGPLSAVQAVCLLAAAGFSWTLWQKRAGERPPDLGAHGQR